MKIFSLRKEDSCIYILLSDHLSRKLWCILVPFISCFFNSLIGEYPCKITSNKTPEILLRYSVLKIGKQIRKNISYKPKSSSVSELSETSCLLLEGAILFPPLPLEPPKVPVVVGYSSSSSSSRIVVMDFGFLGGGVVDKGIFRPALLLCLPP